MSKKKFLLLIPAFNEEKNIEKVIKKILVFKNIINFLIINDGSSDDTKRIIKKYKKNSIMRKPKNGMFIKASKIWQIDKKKSFMIGDQKTDIDFAIKSKIEGYLFNKKNLYDFVKNQVLKNYQ